MPIVTQILSQMSDLSLPQRKLLSHLLSLWPCVQGRFNFLNLSRYSSYCERTLRRHFAAPFDWGAFNARWISRCVPASHHLILAYDHSFIAKSGKQTPGLSWFYNGCAGRTEKGLELALVAVVDLDKQTAYALHAKQTLPETETECKDLKHLQESKPDWPTGVKHFAADGAFARHPFVDGVCALELEFVSKLRHNANLRFLFTGEQSGRGRPKLYDGKVMWKEFQPTRWKSQGQLQKGVEIYSATLFHVSLKRNIKVALLRKSASASTSISGAKGQVLLFSTDLNLSGREIVRMYRARFQIEFLFRGCPLGRAKSGAGLTQCQSRNKEALHFHWNAAFAALNLAKTPQTASAATRFSWASTRQKHANQHFLRLVSTNLDLDWNLIKTHPNFLALVNYGAIQP